MIQISEWVVIYLIIAFFILCVVYLLYFIISRKLFPQETEFHQEISPNKESTVLTVTGSGIIKRVEMQTTENTDSNIMLTVDKTAYTSFITTNPPNNTNNKNPNTQEQHPLKIEANLDRLFHQEFSLFIANKTSTPLNATGKIYYEIKKPLKETIKHMI